MPQKKGLYNHLVDEMQSSADELAKMIDQRIPESIPAIETPNGDDQNFSHTIFDFPGMGQYLSIVPDSLAPLDVIEELEEYITKAKMIVENLFPRRINSGQIVVDVGGDFQFLIQRMDRAFDELERIKGVFTQMQGGQASTTIDLTALRELRENKLPAIGWEYVHNGFVLPTEFRNLDFSNFDRNTLQQIDRSLPPQIEQFAHPPSQPQNVSIPTQKLPSIPKIISNKALERVNLFRR